jgi:rsbT co-antagonist protein RsbR
MEGRVLYANQAQRALTGFGENSLNSRLRDYFDPDEYRLIEERVLPIVQRDGHWLGELTLRRPDGSTWLAQVNGYMLYDAEQQPWAFAAMFRDITEQRRQERELKRLHDLIEDAPVGIGITAPDGTILYSNRTYAAMLNLEEAIGKNIRQVLPSEDLQYFEQVVMPSLLEDGRWEGVRSFGIHNNSPRMTDSNFFVLHDDTGRLEGVAGVVRDISAELKTTRSLRELNERLEQGFMTTPLAMIEFGVDGLVTRWNQSAERIFGWAPDEAVGRNVVELLVPDVAREHVDQVMAFLLQGQVTHSRNENITRDGRRITCQWYNAVLRNSDGTVTGVLSQVEDITERLQQEAERRRAEHERVALQEQVIEAQRVALRELSSPIIPIGEGVVAMPLIGSIDSARAQQIIEVLLEGVAESRARVAILDITGVQVVDTQVANGLLRAAQAVKLLGAQALITGIRPEVAQTLVGLGADLSGIITRGTLQSGISYALARK